jgi:SulP family sulfate permease
MKQMAEAQHVQLVFTDVDTRIQTALARGGLVAEENDLFDIFPELDYGMEWCEDRVLTAANMSLIVKSKSFHFQLRAILRSAEMVERFMKYLEQVEFQADTVVINQGDESDSMYFVESGQLTAKLAVETGKFIRLRGMGPGTVVGEIGLFLNSPRTATVVATQPATLYRLSADRLKEMEAQDPDLASILQRWIMNLLGARLNDQNRTIEALLK